MCINQLFNTSVFYIANDLAKNISVNVQCLLAKTGAEKSVDDLVSLWNCSNLSAVIWQKNKGHPINFLLEKI